MRWNAFCHDLYGDNDTSNTLLLPIENKGRGEIPMSFPKAPVNVIKLIFMKENRKKR